jgi:hypothetical protein
LDLLGIIKKTYSHSTFCFFLYQFILFPEIITNFAAANCINKLKKKIRNA